MKRYHIAYYLSYDKVKVGGITIFSKNMLEALYQYQEKQMDIKLVKYVVEMDDYPNAESYLPANSLNGKAVL